MNSNLLVLTERIRNTIQLGESHFREFKTALEGKPDSKKPRKASKICEDIAEALVAFANADGGELLIGIEDNGVLTGLRHSDEEINNMLNALKTHVLGNQQLPLITSLCIEIDELKLLYFSVGKGTTQIYQLADGRCVKRKDRETIPAAADHIQFERNEIRSREYDGKFSESATVSDLDFDLLQSAADTYLRGMSAEKYLQQTGLAEYGSAGLRLRNAALLLFAKKINKWHPRSQVRFLTIDGLEIGAGEGYNVIADEIVEGNILELTIRAWDRLRSFLAVKTRFGTDSRFEQLYLYPEEACREAILNALAHRDYSIQNGIEIFIFNDRIELKSPGALLSSVDIKTLYKLEGVHESRNSLISRVLRENKYMRELGEGMKRMFNSMLTSELESPHLYSNGVWFSITFKNHSIYTPEQQDFLKHFSSYSLTKIQKRILLLGINGQNISPKQIETAIQSNDLRTYNKEVTILRKAGLLKQIRTNAQASLFSTQQNVIKNEIARFAVVIPDSPTLL
ncbi:MAG: ATP-binding protein [Bacteroidia bacterium]